MLEARLGRHEVANVVVRVKPVLKLYLATDWADPAIISLHKDSTVLCPSVLDQPVPLQLTSPERE